MRVVFFATPEHAVPPLASVAQHHELAAVVCRPDSPRGRGKKLEPPATKVWAEEHGITVHQPRKLNDGAFESWLKDQAPELCLVVAYGRMLKQPILDVPPKGYLNVHPSLLPKYRGPSPVQTAILNGDTETGVTIMAVDAGMDSGDVLLQEKMAIDAEDTSETLSKKLFKRGASLLVEGVNLLEGGEALFTPQDESEVTVTTLFEKQDGLIDWTKSARQIHNLVRAAIPWPAAHSTFNGELCRIHKTTVLDESPTAPPGTVVRVEKDHVVLATGKDALAIHVFQAPGKRAMPMADFLRGHSISEGEVFGA